MIISTRSIVVSSMRFGETSLIVRCFTEQAGLKSYMLKGILAQKKGKIRASLFQPLNVLDLVAFHRNKGTLESLREAHLLNPYTSIPFSVNKRSIGLFIAELIQNSLKEDGPDVKLFHFICQSLQLLDKEQFVPDFHLLFMVKLSLFLGFYPSDWKAGDVYFSLEDGIFTTTEPPGPYLDSNQANYLKKLLKCDYKDLEDNPMPYPIRILLLNNLVRYYQLHLPAFNPPQSIGILHETLL